MTAGTIQIELATDRSAIDRLMAALDQFSEDTGLPERAENQLRLCLDELVVNAISYGFDDGMNGVILVAVTYQGDSLAVRMEDNGKPFNPFEEAAKPDLKADVEEREIGGLGVLFVTSYAKEYGYERNGEKNVIRLLLDA